ncbi:hypothetical protein KAFR_0A00120 [Kazachstania africana CBS 2517]|uniref:Flo11 domain-containing protein n=1 Tax=Kazachstania africana (strain ATCC 22294 / BCRC 22015 / CBS 2517 / CECT 1963 / NBRC 1671 / NRRL Y-8276) TaxID=1071382 RepID=H2AM50_KAZAF|nr:hypothetical protein KAFR_0A00120 [Kazachstania africana CBS 2517]CCF55450.1 hypothetical protein KAFR_0A00120 [Kazachstania africana CBS 2517]
MCFLALFFLIQVVFCELTFPDTSGDLPSSTADCSEGSFMITHEGFAYWDGDLPTDVADNLTNALNDMFGVTFDNEIKQIYKLSESGYVIGVFGGIQVDSSITNILTIVSTPIVYENGINNYFYLESHTGDLKATYGFIVAREEYDAYVDEAVKTWSMGRSYDFYTSTQSIGNVNVCQRLAEEAYSPVNSAEFGECISIFYDSSKTIEEQTGLTDDLLYVYNNGTVSFNDGDKVCISIGTASE